MAESHTHEVTFCSRVSKWADTLFANNPSWPFTKSEIEETTQRKRSDLRFYGTSGKTVLAGEVKLPGTVEGRNPHNADLVEDAYLKASRLGAQFFFTWNVNRFVLFDLKQWNVPISERRVREYDLGLSLEKPEDVSRSEVEEKIRSFLTTFFGELKEIIEGIRPDWGMAPDEYFIRAFESHVAWPVHLTSDFLYAECERSKKFDTDLQEWMTKDQEWAVVRNDLNIWRVLIDRAARTLCYVFSNRLLFYKSVSAKFSALKPLGLPRKVSSADELYSYFQKAFQKAVDETGDYETLFYPQQKDWAGPLIFAHPESASAWLSVIQNLEPFDFKKIPTDILGGIFKRLIAPEERHRFGQHYTNEDIVDIVNAFCIRKPTDTVLDPACGSGSFLVRAYQRKVTLQPTISHQKLLSQIYGVDISLFATHLATLNLAARDVGDDDNYPRISRRNFFEINSEKPFCYLPTGPAGKKQTVSVQLAKVDAVVGNPPYVRQELIPKRDSKPKPQRLQAKEDLQELCERLWPGLRLNGRSDLHCYFWPAAAHFLPNVGWLGFLVSSSWLDVEYGFALQRWILQNFTIQAILESNAEPWFEDARVKTCAVILQRCDDVCIRNAHLVKFVRLNARLKEILGQRDGETDRQYAAEKFRDTIASCTGSFSSDQFRIIVKKQSELWDDGVRAAQLFELQKQRALGEAHQSSIEDDNDEVEEDESEQSSGEVGLLELGSESYGGGKWGKYLRAPNLYFRLTRNLANRFVPFGEIASIRFGVKSGCDAFFMVRDVTDKFLDKYSKGNWNSAPLYLHCKRSEVESGKVRLIRAGDSTVHPVEAKYLAPEVHSLMEIKRPVMTGDALSRRILLVSEPQSKLKETYVHKYLKFGEKTTFASKKSKAVPVPERPTCAGRNPWYDLTYTKRGQIVWPKSQQYRHVVMFNKSRLIVNCNLYDVSVDENKIDAEVLAAILNSTLVGLMKIYFGRYAGTEANLKTEVVDVNLLEIPDPRLATQDIASKLINAFKNLAQRDARPMVEEAFMECRSSERAAKLDKNPVTLPLELRMDDRRSLDLAVFELLGIEDTTEREHVCDELYFETASHFRQSRIVEIQKQEQRAKTDGQGFRAEELAADLWDALDDDEKKPLLEWLSHEVAGGTYITVPAGKAQLPAATDMFAANSVLFSRGAAKSDITHLELPSRAHAELIYTLATNRIIGDISLPKSTAEAEELLSDLSKRLSQMRERALQLARSRTSDEAKAMELAGLLQLWIVHGKPERRSLS